MDEEVNVDTLTRGIRAMFCGSFIVLQVTHNISISQETDPSQPRSIRSKDRLHPLSIEY